MMKDSPFGLDRGHVGLADHAGVGDDDDLTQGSPPRFSTIRTAVAPENVFTRRMNAATS
jgi:hypothetical protein